MHPNSGKISHGWDSSACCIFYWTSAYAEEVAVFQSSIFIESQET